MKIFKLSNIFLLLFIFDTLYLCCCLSLALGIGIRHALHSHTHLASLMPLGKAKVMPYAPLFITKHYADLSFSTGASNRR